MPLTASSGVTGASREAPPVTLSLSIRQLLRWHHHRSALFLDQDHDEFCRLGLAGVSANDVNIVGAFIEGLSWFQGDRLATLQLHHDGALHYVNERVCIVPVNRVRRAGRVLYEDHQS